MTVTVNPRVAPESTEVSLLIGGMTCGACAARIEQRLNALDGVEARVNYASERATAVLPADVSVGRLIEEVAAAGYSAELPAEERTGDGGEEIDGRVRDLRRRLFVSALLFMPLCDTSIAFSVAPNLRFPGWQWLMVALAAPVVTWAAWPFYRAAVRAARHGLSTMDTLVSLGIVSSTVWSLYAMFRRDASRVSHSMLFMLVHRSAGAIYLDVAAGVTTFVLAGRYFEAWSRQRSGNALRALAAVGAKDVGIIDATGFERRRPVSALAVGDRFIVRPGETVATDGEVVFGQSAVDRSVLTGESQPLDVGQGDAVVGGTVSTSGRLVVRATKVGRDTQLAQMLRLVEHAQNEKAAVQRLADRVCNVFVPAVLLIALGTLAAWLLLGYSSEQAFTAALSVLVIACPCALGLATPAALYVAAGEGARSGIFFKGYRALEASKQVDTVVLDKTGTLTLGKMNVTDIAACPGWRPRRFCVGPARWNRLPNTLLVLPSPPAPAMSSALCPRCSPSSPCRGWAPRVSSKVTASPSDVVRRRRIRPRPRSRIAARNGSDKVVRVCWSGPAEQWWAPSQWRTPCASQRCRPCTGCSSSACAAFS